MEKTLPNTEIQILGTYEGILGSRRLVAGKTPRRRRPVVRLSKRDAACYSWAAYPAGLPVLDG